MYDLEELSLLKKGDKNEEFVSIIADEKLCVYFPGTVIKTYAQKSQRYGLSNIIFMSDEKGDYVWYLVQVTNFIDGYLYDKNEVNLVSNPVVERAFKAILDGGVKFDLVSFPGKVDGVILSQNRPYHFIYDQMVNLYELLEKGSLSKEKVFIDDSNFINSIDGEPFQKAKSGCYLFPTLYKGRIKGRVVDLFHEKIVSRSDAKEYTEECVLWFGITGQKRSWIEQVDACIALVKEMRKNYSSVALIIDGWTSYSTGKSFTKEDHAVFEMIKNSLKRTSSVSFFNIIDMNYEEKIYYAKNIDFFVANSGSGSIIPLMFLKKNGVIHGKLNTFSNCYGKNVLKVPERKMKSENSGVAMIDSYSFHWSIVYNLLISLGCSGKRIEEKKVRPTSKIVFGNLSFNEEDKSADVLRDIALKFESIGEIKSALIIMEKALEQRPKGPLIKKKVNEYRKKLSPLSFQNFFKKYF